MAITDRSCLRSVESAVDDTGARPRIPCTDAPPPAPLDALDRGASGGAGWPEASTNTARRSHTRMVASSEPEKRKFSSVAKQVTGSVCPTCLPMSS